MPWAESEIRDSALKYFQKIETYCKENHIELEVITMPVPKETLENMAENYKQSDQYFASFMEERKIPYHNFNYDLQTGFDRSIDSYWDYDGHMYGEDAEKFSRELGKYLARQEETQAER